jgi:hypothetical protein
VSRRCADIPNVAGVDTKAQPGKQAVPDRFTKEHVADDGVNASSGFLREDGVSRVSGEVLGVCVVRSEFLDGLDKALVEEHLADVGGLSAVESAIG